MKKLESKLSLCPLCGKKMVIKIKDTSFDDRNSRTYDRTIFWCKKDDVWKRIEIPEKTLKTIESIKYD